MAQSYRASQFEPFQELPNSNCFASFVFNLSLVLQTLSFGASVSALSLAWRPRWGPFFSPQLCPKPPACPLISIFQRLRIMLIVDSHSNLSQSPFQDAILMQSSDGHKVPSFLFSSLVVQKAHSNIQIFLFIDYIIMKGLFWQI